jgi:hypothetical protein
MKAPVALVGFVAASLAFVVSGAAPASADILPNVKPGGCFAIVSRDWNRHSPQSIAAFSDYADRFQRCSLKDRSEVQVRSDLVGWYKSELGLTLTYYQLGEEAIALRHYDRCYTVFDRMATLSQRAGDVQLARWVTETSGRLALFEDAFDADHQDVGSLPPR